MGNAAQFDRCGDGGTGMSAPIVQGWCPGALRPMLSGDGLVVRIRPRGGRLSADQVAGIAALSATHGNGLIDLSSRANMQLRGVTDASYDALMAGLQALSLLDVSAEAEARRNILVTPFWQAGDGAQEIAAGLAQALVAADAPDLSGKFGFAVDTGAVPVLGAASADIRIEQGLYGLICRADGAASGEAVTVDTAVDAALRLAQWFVESGGVRDGRGRMAAHVGGQEKFSSENFSAPVPGAHALGYLVALEFGQIAAATLAGLGDVRLTPWRMLLLEGVNSAPDLPGLITRADDPLLRVVACTGAPGCPQGLQPTRALARALAAHVPKGRLLHVSGCAKGCAMPKTAAMVLVGQSAGYGFAQNGLTSDAPVQTGLTATGLLADPSIFLGRP
jgi:precorrin-3B synthase